MKTLAMAVALTAAAACTPQEAAMYSFYVHLDDAGVSPPPLEQTQCVIAHESGGRNVVSPTGDYGPFQINRRTWQPVFPEADLLDPVTNGAVAAEVYRRAGGWSPWVGARVGRCA